MKRITLKRMELKNFKGVRSMNVTFGSETSVFGRNGTGKTTVYDAFTWVLFDKDSRSSGAFQVATNDQNGMFIPRLEHEVSVTMDIDGETTTLTKRTADKWVTMRGTVTPKLKGWETTYQINNVPCKKSDFDKFVADICGYDTFKMVTMPGYFMSKPENERRTILLNMAGCDLATHNLIGEDADLEDVVKLLENKTYEDVNKQMKAEKAKYNKERDELESGIVTLNAAIRTDLPTTEYVEGRIRETEQRILDIDRQITDRTSALKTAQAKNKERMKEILAASNEVGRLITSKIAEAQRRRNTLEANITALRTNIQGLQGTIAYLKKQSEYQLSVYEEKSRIRDEFVAKLNKIKVEQFHYTEDDLVCPLCKRPFEGESRQERFTELQKNFMEDKVRRLQDIQKAAKPNTEERDRAQHQNALILADIAAKKQEIAQLESRVAAYNKELEELEIPTEEQLMKNDTEVVAAHKKYEELEKSKETEIPSVDVTDLQDQQRSLRQTLAQLNQQLAEIKRNEEDKKRVKAKEDRISEIASAIAEMELMEDKLIRFSRQRAMVLEERVNKMFSMVNFKFLIEQINGGIKEVCEPYYNGAPYSTNLNNGARINAGIDICTAIAEYYGIKAPIFVDNAEASNTFIPTDTQMIKLIVSEDDRLRITTE